MARKNLDRPLEKIEVLHQRALFEQHGLEYDQDYYPLPPWAEEVRALPNDLARSSLFSIRNKRKPRLGMTQKPLFHHHNGTRVHYTGVELRAADDEIIFQQVLHYTKQAGGVGIEFQFTPYQLCKDIGLEPGGSAYRTIEASLERLHSGTVFVTSPKYSRIPGIHLLETFVREQRRGRSSLCTVRIHPAIIAMFLGGTFTHIPWKRYLSLTPIARRLYDYIGSHKQPYPLMLERFQSLTGSECSNQSKWRSMVSVACKELEEAEMVTFAHVEGRAIVARR